MNVFHNLWRKFEPIVFNVSVASLIAPLDTVDLLNFIVVIKAHDQLSDHYVESWAETATRHDANFRLFGVAEKLLPGACFDKFD